MSSSIHLNEDHVKQIAPEEVDWLQSKFVVNTDKRPWVGDNIHSCNCKSWPCIGAGIAVTAGINQTKEDA